jgi:hypothetical protein
MATHIVDVTIAKYVSQTHKNRGQGKAKSARYVKNKRHEQVLQRRSCKTTHIFEGASTDRTEVVYPLTFAPICFDLPKDATIVGDIPWYPYFPRSQEKTCSALRPQSKTQVPPSSSPYTSSSSARSRQLYLRAESPLMQSWPIMQSRAMPQISFYRICHMNCLCLPLVLVPLAKLARRGIHWLKILQSALYLTQRSCSFNYARVPACHITCVVLATSQPLICRHEILRACCASCVHTPALSLATAKLCSLCACTHTRDRAW